MKVIRAIGFYFISFTWGIIMSLIGAIIALGLLITGHRPHRFHYFIYFEVGENWGGFECGCFFVTNKNPSLSMKQHESGHGLQNLMFGPLMPFIVSIPSAVRYWYREIVVRAGRKRYEDLPSYYSIWFEGQASKLGEKYFK